MEAFQQAVSVFRYAQYPLAHRLADHRVPTALALSVDNFFVGEYCSERRAPIDRHLVDVRQPALVEFEEDPLRPLEVIGIGGIHLSAPIVGEAERLKLLSEALDVALGRLSRVRSRLNGVLLRRQPKRVPPHRVKHVETVHALVARDDIGGGVTFRVPYVQPRATRIWEHVEHVVLRPVARWLVRCAKRLISLPERLPLRFDF